MLKLSFRLSLLILTAPALAALSAGRYSIRTSSIDSGGGSSSAGIYRLQGTVGQAAAGTLAAGRYALKGGVWSDDVLFRNGFQ